MFKLSIDDIVEVPVKFTLKSGSVNKNFELTLIAKRLPQDVIVERLKSVEFRYVDFMLSPDLVTDWRDQRLVLDTSGNPAEFGVDAYTLLLKTQGVAQVCFNAYQNEVGAKEKN